MTLVTINCWPIGNSGACSLLGIPGLHAELNFRPNIHINDACQLASRHAFC
jgi:hypothetical protein